MKPKLGPGGLGIVTPGSLRPSPPPPAPVEIRRPVQNMRGMMRQRPDDERTILRPTGMPLMAPSPAPVAATPPSMLPTPYMPFKPPVPPSIRPQPIEQMVEQVREVRESREARAPSAPPPALARTIPPPAPGKPKSDPRLDPPAAIITSRHRTSPRRTNLSWAAALLAGGVFIGLVTAVLARGEGDAILDATASFVDPSQTHAQPVTPGAQVGSQAGASVHAASAGKVEPKVEAKAEPKAEAKVEPKKDSAAALVGACLGTSEAASTPAPVAVIAAQYGTTW